MMKIVLTRDKANERVSLKTLYFAYVIDIKNKKLRFVAFSQISKSSS